MGLRRPIIGWGVLLTVTRCRKRIKGSISGGKAPEVLSLCFRYETVTSIRLIELTRVFLFAKLVDPQSTSPSHGVQVMFLRHIVDQVTPLTQPFRLVLTLTVFGSLSAAALTGCGGTSSGTLPISGKVTYQGKAVPNLRVSFSSKSGTRPADGVTDAEGKYKLGTFMAGDGALPGDYLVAIQTAGTDSTKPPSVEITDASEYDVPKVDPTKPGIPAKYAAPSSSGLKAVITVGGPKEFNFDLKD